MKQIVLITFLLITIHAQAVLKTRTDVKEIKWDSGDVTFLEDNRFPMYTISIYFADGALSDKPRTIGETDLMFDMLTSGTNRYSQREIADHLEYYGVIYGHFVTHEYSSFTLAGLSKDIIPTLKLVCHLFRNTNFDKREVAKEKKIRISSIKNYVTSPATIANRAFRSITMANTLYDQPATGSISSIHKISSKNLKNKIKYFNEKVKKRIYIAGPSSLMQIKGLFNSECGWSTKTNTFSRVAPKMKDISNKKEQIIHLVTIPKSNQAQIQIGRFLNRSEVRNRNEIMTLTSSFLGGGFTSRLMQELRVDRGLTYSIGSYLSAQKYYGRSGIITSIRNDKVVEGLKVIKEVLDSTSKGDFLEEELQQIIGFVAGGHLFQFEKTSDFLSKIMYYDHIENSYEEIFKFPELIRMFTKDDVSEAIKEYFDWSKLDVLVLGDASLKKPLSELGKVKVYNYKKFL